MTRLVDQDALTEIITQAVTQDSFSGVVRVQQGQQVLVEAAAGLANRAWRQPNRSDTRFRLASVGKMFTAVAVLRLIEQGRLSFDLPLAAYLGLEDSSLPPEATLRHYLTMTAGIGDYLDEAQDEDAEWERLCRLAPLHTLRDNRAYLPLFVTRPALQTVGLGYTYSNAGYILLGLAIEQAAEESYFDAVRRLVFAPAGMDTADFIDLDDVVENVAEGYLPLEAEDGSISGWQRNIYAATPGPAADGGATGSAEDLVRFSAALRDGRLLSPEMTQAMLSPQVLDVADPQRACSWCYSYGNMLMCAPGEGTAQWGRVLRWGHTGEEAGVSCRLYHYPAQELDVIILSNHSGGAGKLGWALHALLV